jgi:hypothetical protein
MKIISLAIFLVFPALAQTPTVDFSHLDFNRQKAEILERYRALLRIDTSSPPGNETKAVEYLK